MYFIPQDLKDAIRVFLCERTYLIQMCKALIERVIPKEMPKFFNDPFL